MPLNATGLKPARHRAEIRSGWGHGTYWLGWYGLAHHVSRAGAGPGLWRWRQEGRRKGRPYNQRRSL